MVPFVLIGTFWFWILIGLTIATVWAILAADETGIMASIVAVLVLIGLWIFTDFSIVNVFHHPWHYLMYVGVYIVLGFGWSLWKLIDYAKKEKTKYQAALPGWKNKYQMWVNKKVLDDAKNANNVMSFEKWMIDANGYYYPPKASTLADKIYVWTVYWPISIVTTFLGEYIFRFFKWVYTYLAGFYQRVIDWVWSDTGLTG